MEKMEEVTKGMKRHDDTLELGVTIIEAEDGSYIGYLNAMPGVCTTAKDKDNIKPMLMDAFKAMMEYMEDRHKRYSIIENITSGKTVKLMIDENPEESA